MVILVNILKGEHFTFQQSAQEDDDLAQGFARQNDSVTALAHQGGLSFKESFAFINADFSRLGEFEIGIDEVPDDLITFLHFEQKILILSKLDPDCGVIAGCVIFVFEINESIQLGAKCDEGEFVIGLIEILFMEEVLDFYIFYFEPVDSLQLFFEGLFEDVKGGRVYFMFIKGRELPECVSDIW